MSIPTPESRHAEGLTLWRSGRLDEALDVLGHGLDAHPEDAGLRTSFGLVLAALGLATEAVCAWRQALAQDPAMGSALVNLAKDEGDAERACILCRRALAVDAADAAALGNLGVHEERRGKDAYARCLYARALALEPAGARLWSNLGSLEHWGARLVEAGRSLERALALAPDFAEARLNRAINRLLQGDWRKGLVDYEARRHKPGAFRPSPALPSWRGEDIRAKRLLLWAEQGQGDVIQFLRFVPAVAARGAHVILLVPRPLLSLVEGFAGVAEVAAVEALPTAGPPAADVGAPLLSLPLLLGLGAATPRAMPPYLSAPFVARPAPLPTTPAHAGDERPRIGLVWAGNPANQTDVMRSLALVRLAPALALPGLRWVSLQFGPRAADIAAAGLSDRIEDLGGRLGDFAATAGIVAALDLVVTVDTAMAHLAGALGKETWLLLAHVPDWRWGMSGETTSWYPSMRLFRQQRRGDWDGVVESLVAALVQRFRLPVAYR
jgi:Flp pilus assembly protein TadD